MGPRGGAISYEPGTPVNADPPTLFAQVSFVLEAVNYIVDDVVTCLPAPGVDAREGCRAQDLGSRV